MFWIKARSLKRQLSASLEDRWCSLYICHILYYAKCWLVVWTHNMIWNIVYRTLETVAEQWPLCWLYHNIKSHQSACILHCNSMLYFHRFIQYTTRYYKVQYIYPCIIIREELTLEKIQANGVVKTVARI